MTRRPTIAHTTVARTLAALERATLALRAGEKSLALVPTMGALHAGHLALVQLAQRKADRVVVSIFVNPTQFAPNEDLVAYPRTFAADLRAMRALGVDLIWVPTAAIMYPSGFATRVAPLGAALAGLEDAFRPHFFSGVATVVTKLFAQCRPDVAIFGEKDYQQLLVVTALARDLDLKVGIVAGKTTRERDGLALSSRNAYLDVGERAAAPTLYRTLRWCAAQIGQGRPIGAVLAQGRRAITAAGFRLDYLEARHARTLAPLRRAADGPVRLLVAARIGRTRLVDNIGL